MAEQRLTLGNLLLPDGHGEDRYAWADTAIDAVVSKVPGTDAAAVKGPITGVIDSVLDIGLGDILAGAWNRYRLLREFCDREKYAPGEPILVPMARHTVRSTHKPAISVEVADVSVYRLEFGVDLSLDVEGLLLRIVDCRVREVAAGRCEGKAGLRWGEAVLIEKNTPSFDLPGLLPLGDGIPISTSETGDPAH